MPSGWNLAAKRRSLSFMPDIQEPISKVEVGNRLVLTREALGKTQAEMCRIMGIPPNRWNNAETGDNYPSLADLVRFCQVTGATTDWIQRGIRSGLPASLLEALARLENGLAGGPSSRRRA